jgi:hypothetical protein
MNLAAFSCIHRITSYFDLPMHSSMNPFSQSVLITKAGNQKGLRALLRLILSLKTTISIVQSSITMMHLMTLSISALIDMNLYISGQATQTTVLRHSLLLEVVALALRNRFGTPYTYHSKLLRSSLCVRVLRCEDQSSGQATPMVNHGHLAKSSEIWKICIHGCDRLVLKRIYFLPTLRLKRDLQLPTHPDPAIY